MVKRRSLIRAFALVAVILGLLVAVTPRVIFPVCGAGLLSTGTSPEPRMRCFWFAQAQLLIGGLAVLAGLIVIVRPLRDAVFAAGIMLAGLGAGAILTSVNAIIGSVCMHAGSLCQIGTKPAARVSGGLLIVVGALLTASTFLKDREE